MPQLKSFFVFSVTKGPQIVYFSKNMPKLLHLFMKPNKHSGVNSYKCLADPSLYGALRIGNRAKWYKTDYVTPDLEKMANCVNAVCRIFLN